MHDVPFLRSFLVQLLQFQFLFLAFVFFGQFFQLPAFFVNEKRIAQLFGFEQRAVCHFVVAAFLVGEVEVVVNVIKQERIISDVRQMQYVSGCFYGSRIILLCLSDDELDLVKDDQCHG